MEKYAKVIVRSNTVHTDNLFTYKIPEFLNDEIEVGHRVLVPFGIGNRPTEAFVFEITDKYEEGYRIKSIVDLLDEKPIFKIEDLELVKWMKNRYLCTYIDCINLIYPKGYKLNNYKVVTLNDELQNIKDDDFENYINELDDTSKMILREVKKAKNKIKIEKLKKISNINNKKAQL